MVLLKTTIAAKKIYFRTFVVLLLCVIYLCYSFLVAPCSVYYVLFDHTDPTYFNELNGVF